MSGGEHLRVYLAHCTADAAVGKRLAEGLRERGIGVWLEDWKIWPGDVVVQRIEEGMAGADVFLVLMSEAAIGDGWMRQKYAAALQDAVERDGVLAIPVLVGGVAVDRLPGFLRTRKAVAVGEVERIAGAIRRRLGEGGDETARLRTGMPAPDLLSPEALAEYRRLVRARHEQLDLDGFTRMRSAKGWGRGELAALVSRGPVGWVEAWRRLEAGTRVAVETKVVGGVELVLVPGGSFMMGSPPEEEGDYEDEGPQHPVTLRSFWLARTPVTNAQYRQYMKAYPDVGEPRYWGDRQCNQDEQPVVGVSWNEAKVYCERMGLRLPTEAEWEYACRAGTTTRYCSGDGEEDLARVGWYGGNSGERLHAVKELEANGFGLYDMHGSVWEWCEDRWVGNYERAVHRPEDGLRTQPVGDANRVLRGGNFVSDARDTQSACRYGGWHPDVRDFGVGFRPAQGHL